MDFELTRQVLSALEREGVRYVVFGAVALAIHGLARATEDLDLFIEPDAENIAPIMLARAALRSGATRGARRCVVCWSATARRRSSSLGGSICRGRWPSWRER